MRKQALTLLGINTNDPNDHGLSSLTNNKQIRKKLSFISQTLKHKGIAKTTKLKSWRALCAPSNHYQLNDKTTHNKTIISLINTNPIVQPPPRSAVNANQKIL